MRDIKFRAWHDTNSPKMVHDVTVDSNGWTGLSSMGTHRTLMQFTGLLDKEGIEIYEGDIVQWWDSSDDTPTGHQRTATVHIDPDLYFRAFKIGGILKDEPWDFHFGNFIYTDTEKYLKVIGNIHENPELLEEVNG